MKRSDACERLKHILQNELNTKVSDYDAFNILQQIEDFGMLPPTVEVVSSVRYGFDRCNVWEHEEHE